MCDVAYRCGSVTAVINDSYNIWMKLKSLKVWMEVLNTWLKFRDEDAFGDVEGLDEDMNVGGLEKILDSVFKEKQEGTWKIWFKTEVWKNIK